MITQTLNTIESITMTINGKDVSYTVRHEVETLHEVTYAKQVYTGVGMTGNLLTSTTQTVAHRAMKSRIEATVIETSNAEAKEIVKELMLAGRFDRVEDLGNTRVLRIK